MRQRSVGVCERSDGAVAAMGVDRALALGALRLTLGSTTTDADVDRAAEVIVDAVRRLRRGTS